MNSKAPHRARTDPPVDAAIIGVHKCATTSLWALLRGHEQVATHHTGQLYGDYLDALESGAPLDCLTELRRAYRPGRRVVIRDNTLYDDPERLGRLVSLAPELRIVVAVREPVERAFSAFVHARNKGFETRYPNFADAVDSLRRGEFAERTPSLLNYFDQGRYWNRVERLFGHVPARRVLLIESERLSHDFSGVADALFDFLDVRRVPVEPVVENVRARVRSERLNRYLRHDGGLKRLVRRVVGPERRARLLRAAVGANAVVDRSETMDPDSRAFLADFYASDWRRTRRFMGADGLVAGDR